MESRRYLYCRDRVTLYWTALHIVAILFGVVLLLMLFKGGLFSAWFVSFVVAAVLLMLLSVPRDIEVDDEMVKINCLLDTTEIRLENILSVRKISPREMRWVFPLFGGCGFLGYYGHYFDLKHFRRVVVYASEWRYLVEIVDVYEEHYYLSCREREELVEELNAKLDTNLDSLLDSILDGEDQ